MLVILILSAVVGAILGFRFSVFALGPAILFAGASAIANGVVSRHDHRFIVLSLLETLASLQISYLLSCIVAEYLRVRTKPRPMTWMLTHH